MSFLLLPITTFYLDPADFGFYALVTSITGISAAIACSGSAYALASNFQTATKDEQKSLVTTVLTASLTIGIGLSILFLFGWKVFGVDTVEGTTISPALLWLSMALMVLPIPWTYGVQVSTLDGQTKAYAIIQFTEAIVSGGVTVSILYLNLERQLALFIGATTGAIFTVFGTLWILRPYLGGVIKFRWLREIATVGAASFVSTMAERIQTVAERSFISRYVGIDQLGIYSHSQQYRTLVMAGSNSVGYSVWPISLQEAREEFGRFPRTIQAWRMTGAAIAIIGVVFATLGEYLIGLLTHGKFASAYTFASVWMAYLLIQSTGRIQTARFYVSRAGVSNQNAISVSIVLSIAMLAVLTPTFGIYGVLVGVFSQVIVYRGLLNVIGRNDRSMPFVDGPLIAGAVIVIASTAMAILEPAVMMRLLNLLISCALIGIVFKSALLHALEVSIFARVSMHGRNSTNPPESGP